MQGNPSGGFGYGGDSDAGGKSLSIVPDSTESLRFKY